MSCSHRADGRCGNPAARFHGRTVNIGVCLNDCKAYDGPQRTPAYIAKMTRLSISASKRQSKNRRKPLTADDVKKYVKAEASFIREGPVPPPIYQQRMAQCKHRAVDPADGREYCTQCGCGARDRAKFDVKMHMPDIECKHCGIQPHPGEGRHALKRVGGLRKQMAAIIRSVIKDHGLTWRDVRSILRS